MTTELAAMKSGQTSEDALRRANEELEKRVAERTAALVETAPAPRGRSA